MKLIRRIFSRFTFIALAIVVQLAFFLTSVFLLSEYYVYIQTIIWLISIFFLIKIVNEDTEPSVKIPLIITLLVIPAAGMTIVIIMSANKKPYIIKAEHIEKKTEAYLQELVGNGMLNELSEHSGQSSFLANVCGLPAHLNETKVDYFPSGESFFERYLVDLESAKRFIFIEYFILDEGSMLNALVEILKRKAASGVEVWLMYDDLGCATKLNHSFDKKMRSYGIKCIPFNRLTPIISVLHNNRDHRKITVIDNAIGYTGGINIADEYINKVERFGKWKDSAVRLEGAAVINLTFMFLQLFDTQTVEDEDYTEYLEKVEVVKESGIVQPFGGGPKPFYPHGVGEGAYLNFINEAKKYLYITTPYLIVNYSFLDAIKNAVLRGVDVRIIVPSIPDKKLIYLMTKKNCRSLLKAGVKVYRYTPGFIHAKNLVADGKSAIVGTINLDYRSFIHHFENGVFMRNTACIADIEKDFLETQELSELLTEKNTKVSIFTELAYSVLNLFAPLM